VEHDATPGPVCSSFSFSTGGAIDSLSVDGEQDVPAAVTPSGVTVLLQQRPDCVSDFVLSIADEISAGSGVYAPVDVTDAVLAAGLLAGPERTLTVTSDGLTILGVTSDGQHLAVTSRSAIGAGDFGAGSGTGLEALAVTLAQQLRDPVISADGLAVYYTLVDGDNPDLAGVYESVRGSSDAAWPAGTRMPQVVQDQGIVTAISSDRLTLFLEQSFATSVLTRLTVDDPFANPNDPAPPPSLPGFRARPLADCATLIASCTVAGCPGEDICRFTRD
jgi:hypothetical protein